MNKVFVKSFTDITGVILISKAVSARATGNNNSTMYQSNVVVLCQTVTIHSTGSVDYTQGFWYYPRGYTSAKISYFPFWIFWCDMIRHDHQSCMEYVLKSNHRKWFVRSCVQGSSWLKNLGRSDFSLQEKKGEVS